LKLVFRMLMGDRGEQGKKGTTKDDYELYKEMHREEHLRPLSLPEWPHCNLQKPMVMMVNRC
jgi:hypothetical protein